MRKWLERRRRAQVYALADRLAAEKEYNWHPEAMNRLIEIGLEDGVRHMKRLAEVCKREVSARSAPRHQEGTE